MKFSVLHSLVAGLATHDMSYKTKVFKGTCFCNNTENSELANFMLTRYFMSCRSLGTAMDRRCNRLECVVRKALCFVHLLN
ncbi:hypothetical protein HanIR_Chr09g0421061 [Helianthus annuus]|nr:hypothetical protein HanIR_Chr09g0421061 [Helianthus annuus]